MTAIPLLDPPGFGSGIAFLFQTGHLLKLKKEIKESKSSAPTELHPRFGACRQSQFFLGETIWSLDVPFAHKSILITAEAAIQNDWMPA